MVGVGYLVGVEGACEVTIGVVFVGGGSAWVEADVVDEFEAVELVVFIGGVYALGVGACDTLEEAVCAVGVGEGALLAGLGEEAVTLIVGVGFLVENLAGGVGNGLGFGLTIVVVGEGVLLGCVG